MGLITVWMITHPQKEQGPNPGLNGKGLMQVAQLKKYLPQNYRDMPIVCGIGKRHTDTLKMLGLSAERKNVWFSALAGVSASLEKGMVTLADGTQIDQTRYIRATEEFSNWVYELVLEQGDTVVITSRKNIAPFMDGKLGKTGAVYKLTITTDESKESEFCLKEVYTAK